MTFSPIPPNFFFFFRQTFIMKAIIGLTDFFLSRPVGISTKLPAMDDEQWKILFPPPYRFSTFPFLFSSFFQGFFILSLSLSFSSLPPSTIVTTVSKKKEINRDNIYLPLPSLEKRIQRKTSNNQTYQLRSSYRIFAIPCREIEFKER